MFFSLIRNAVLLLKLHGFFPYENYRSDDGRNLSFKWYSYNALWGFSLYVLIGVILYALSSNEHTNVFILFGYVIRICFLYVCYFVNNDYFLTLMVKLEKVNDKFPLDRETTITPFNNNTKLWILFEIFIFSFYCFWKTIFFVSTMEDLSPVLLTVLVFLTAFVAVTETYVLLFYSLLVYYIKHFYRHLDAQLENIFNNTVDLKQQAVDQFEYFRILHAELSDICDCLQKWFGMTYLCIITTLVSKTLLTFYKVTMIESKISLLNDGFSLLEVFAYLFVVTTAAQNLIDSNTMINDILQKVKTVFFTSDLLFQIRLSRLQTNCLPINILAVGLFKTNRSLIPSILSVIAVYITVMIELEIPLELISNFLKNI